MSTKQETFTEADMEMEFVRGTRHGLNLAIQALKSKAALAFLQHKDELAGTLRDQAKSLEDEKMKLHTP